MGYAFQITSIYTYIYLLFATANGKKAQKTNAKHARSPALSLSCSLALILLSFSYSLSVNAADYFGIFCATPCMCITYIHLYTYRRVHVCAFVYVKRIGEHCTRF